MFFCKKQYIWKYGALSTIICLCFFLYKNGLVSWENTKEKHNNLITHKVDHKKLSISYRKKTHIKTGLW